VGRRQDRVDMQCALLFHCRSLILPTPGHVQAVVVFQLCGLACVVAAGPHGRDEVRLTGIARPSLV
jgi:hypothetical protein